MDPSPCLTGEYGSPDWFLKESQPGGYHNPCNEQGHGEHQTEVTRHRMKTCIEALTLVNFHGGVYGEVAYEKPDVDVY